MRRRCRWFKAGKATRHGHGELLAKVIVGMTISLDGFVADQNGNAGRLYPDLEALRHTAYMKDAIEQTGAVLMGRRTFEMGDPTRTSATTNSKCRFSC